MAKKHRKKRKFRWLRRFKRWSTKLIAIAKRESRPRKRRKKRRRSKKQLAPSMMSYSQNPARLFQPQNPPKRRRRTKSKKTLSKKIARSWLQFTKSITEWNSSLFHPKKKSRKRRRRRKQYAQYVLSGQKKID